MGIQENQKFVNIKQCKGFVRVCYLKLNLEKETAQRLWIPIFDKKRTQEQLKDTTGRVYIIVIDGIIFKIGYTEYNSGIKVGDILVFIDKDGDQKSFYRSDKLK